MAELFVNGDTEPFDISCHIGERGHIIVPVNDDAFMALTPMEAQQLAQLLRKQVAEYKKDLTDEYEIEAAE